jgi:hypothetical protein
MRIKNAAQPLRAAHDAVAHSYEEWEECVAPNHFTQRLASLLRTIRALLYSATGLGFARVVSSDNKTFSSFKFFSRVSSL